MSLLRSQVVQAQCPGCQKYLKIPANWIHEPMKCKNCGLVFQAKAPPAAPPAPSTRTPLPPKPLAAKPVALQSRPYAPPPGVPVAAPVPMHGGVPVAQPSVPVAQTAVPVARPVNPMAGVPIAAPVAMPGMYQAPTAAPVGYRPPTAPPAPPAPNPFAAAANRSAPAPTYRRRSRGGMQKLAFVMVFLLGLGSMGAVIAHLAGVDFGQGQFGFVLSTGSDKDNTETTTTPTNNGIGGTNGTGGAVPPGDSKQVGTKPPKATGATRAQLIDPPMPSRRVIIDPPPPPPPPPPPMDTRKRPIETKKEMPQDTKKDPPVDTRPKKDPSSDEPPPVTTVSKGSFPRRLLVVSVNNYPYANPVSGGSGDRDTTKVVLSFAKLLSIPADQVTLLSDKGRINMPPQMPPVKEVIEQAITQYLDGSRPQDRIILMFVGHMVEVEDMPYLMPLEGEADKKESLIPLDWLYQKLAACPAQQKVLMLDVCRFDPTTGVVRAEVAPMGEKSDAMLARPPKGVQVLTACTAGQRSLELTSKLTSDGLVDGGIMLNQAAILQANGGIRGLTQKPDDPLPLKDLERKLSSSTKAMANAFLKAPQTPRLAGELVRSIPFDKAAALPKGITPTLPEKFKNGVASVDDLKGMFKRVADIPPVKQSEEGTPFSVDSLPPYPKDAVAEYKDDGMDSPFRAAVKDGVTKLQQSARDFKINETFPSLPEQQLTQEKRRIEALQKDKVGDAFFQLGKVAEELEQLKEDKAKESKYWQAMYDYVLARLYARQAYILEYNVMLGKIRRDDMPMLDKQVNKGWKLAAKKDLSDKDAKELADKSKKILETVAKDHKGSPWELIGKRESITSLGLEWTPN